MSERPISQVIIRKYEPPTKDFDSNLKRFMLSLGLIRVGDKNPPIFQIFKEIVVSKHPVSVKKLGQQTKLSNSAVRYHIQKLKFLRLVDGRGSYSLSEQGDLLTSFKIFRRFVLEEILERIEEYAARLNDRP